MLKHDVIPLILHNMDLNTIPCNSLDSLEYSPIKTEFCELLYFCE